MNLSRHQIFRQGAKIPSNSSSLCMIPRYSSYKIFSTPIIINMRGIALLCWQVVFVKMKKEMFFGLNDGYNVI